MLVLFPAELKKKEGFLLPLEDLAEPTRGDVLRTLREVVGDRNTLTLLEKTVRSE